MNRRDVLKAGLAAGIASISTEATGMAESNHFYELRIYELRNDWARVKNKPGWTDPEAVSNIHAAFLRPTAYSQIR